MSDDGMRIDKTTWLCLQVLDDGYLIGLRPSRSAVAAAEWSVDFFYMLVSTVTAVSRA